MILLRQVIALMFVCVTNIQARAETMTWAMQDFAPIYMPVNGKPGLGINDATLKSIIREMPGIEHKFVVASVARIYALLDAGEQLCFVGGLRTPERERRYYLADVQAVPPLQVVARKAALARMPLDVEGRVDLPALLAMPELRGTFVAKRSYGHLIDQWLEERPPGPHVAVLSGASMGSNFYEMLARERVDYTVDFDFMLQYRSRLAGKKFSALATLPIKGNDQLEAVVAVCPRTVWGKIAITNIDLVLAKLASTQGLGLPDPLWATPEAMRNYGSAMRAFSEARRLTSPDPGSSKIEIQIGKLGPK